MSISLSFKVINPNNWGAASQIQNIEKDIQAAADAWGGILVGSAALTVTLNLQNSIQIGSSNYLASAASSDFIFAEKDGTQNLFESSTQLSLLTNTSKNDGRSTD